MYSFNTVKTFAAHIQIAVVVTILTQAQTSFAECGVVDLHGKFVIPPKYSQIEAVGDRGFVAKFEGTNEANRAKAFLTNKYFDRNGQEITPVSEPPPVSRSFKGVPTGYSVETPLTDGCIVKADAAHGGKLGYIDGNGQVRLPFEFQTLRDVRESRFLAGNPDQAKVMRYFLYDMSGRLIAKLPEFVQDYPNGIYQEGLFLVGDEIGRAFLDLDGKVAIPPNKYQYPSPIYQGLAEIQYKENGELFCGYVDKQNKLVSEIFKDSRADPFYRGLGVITKISTDGTVKLGAVDKSGKLIFPIEFEPFDFMGERLVGGRRDGKFQLFLRESGKLYATLPEGCIAAAVYDFDKNNIIPFNVGGVPPSPGMNGNTAVGGKWGYCDEHGKIVIEPTLKFASLFTGDVAVACMEDKFGDTKMGLIDKKGQWQLPPTYAGIQMTGKDRAIVYTGGKTSAIGKAFQDPAQRTIGVFKEVLKYYDLIGMSEADLDSVLGKGAVLVDQQEVPPSIRKRVCYDFPPLFLGGKPALSVEFGMDANDKVWGWRFREPNGSWDWYSENKVIVNYDRVLTGKNIVPKAKLPE